MRKVPKVTEAGRWKWLGWVEEYLEQDWRDVIWSDEVPLTAGRDPRRSWVTRRAGEQYNPGFTKPQRSKYMEIMAGGCIAYSYKSPLTRFNLKAPTPEL